MKPDDKNKPLKKPLQDQLRRFNDLLREKEDAARARAAREQQERENQAKISYKLSDGTIYAGISPDTKKPMYAMPTDAPLAMTFNEAADYATRLNQERCLGHDDWRLPTRNELNVLFRNRAAIGKFDTSGAEHTGWYWSSTRASRWAAWEQRFDDGDQIAYDKLDPSSVRLVR